MQVLEQLFLINSSLILSNNEQRSIQLRSWNASSGLLSSQRNSVHMLQGDPVMQMKALSPLTIRRFVLETHF